MRSFPKEKVVNHDFVDMFIPRKRLLFLLIFCVLFDFPKQYFWNLHPFYGLMDSNDCNFKIRRISELVELKLLIYAHPEYWKHCLFFFFFNNMYLFFVQNLRIWTIYRFDIISIQLYKCTIQLIWIWFGFQLFIGQSTENPIRWTEENYKLKVFLSYCSCQWPTFSCIILSKIDMKLDQNYTTDICYVKMYSNFFYCIWYKSIF